MKKLLFMLAAVAMYGFAAADDRPVDYNQLPKDAKAFIAKHFKSARVLSTLMDNDFMDKEYTVYMDGGTKVEFRGNGAWKEVNAGMGTVPASVVPAKIANYVKANYAGTQINKIDMDKTDYELKLSNGMELKFTLAGDFMMAEMDD